jgi:site-specific DNA-methyltransferase (adenine-specific)
VGEDVALGKIMNKTINQDLFSLLEFLPSNAFDLIIADPPYHLTKTFNGRTFHWKSWQDYEDYLESWIPEMARLLKSQGSMYICGDWRSSSAIHRVAEKHLKIQNRITWEREKGRGALSNWKNSSEDIWFCTKSDDYYFNVNAVKLKRKVVAPYKQNGKPKDWQKTDEGNFRLTHPSNLWTDISVPFWSMPENTDHPTQKPEKLIAKMILASSKEGDVVFDPFLGSGTTSVVAKKLGRKYVGVEIDETYCALAEKRLVMAEDAKGIQGYQDGVFLERNTLTLQQVTINHSIKATKLIAFNCW